MDLNYCAVVHARDGLFWIEFPDFPEVSTRGACPDDDPAMVAAECLADAIILRLAEGEPIPCPESLDTVRSSIGGRDSDGLELSVIEVAPRQRGICEAA